VTSTEEAFSFEFIRHSSSTCMSFYRLVPSSEGLATFRLALSRIDLPFQHVILTFSTSQMRWCFLSSPCRVCPLCFSKSWLWEHFFDCSIISPLLSSRNISMPRLKDAIRGSDWRKVFSYVAEVLLCWHFALESTLVHRTFSYDPDVFRSLLKSNS
jgi:hypothetical protein